MFSSPAFAQAAGGTAASGPPGYLMIVPWVAIFAIMYFLMIRPQQTRAKRHRAMLETLKRGDQVVTAGGVLGKVTRVDEAEAEVEIANGVRIRVVKATLTEVRGAKPAND